MAAMRTFRSPGFQRALRIAVAVAVLAALVVRVGAGPFLHGLASLDGPSIAAAVALCAVATGAAAWRWRLLARRLGIPLGWSAAVGRYYRSQFVNVVLPGGVVGDVQRALDHGREAALLAASARAVVAERMLGQLVLIALSALVLGVSGGPFAALAPWTGVGALLLAGAVGVAAAASARVRRLLSREAAALRDALGSVSVTLRAAAASALVVACHVATFAVAAAAVGARLEPGRIVPVALVVLLAASLPANVGGWGPREGAAGWAFALAGAGAAAGVSAATLFGVLTFIAVVPGAAADRIVSLIVWRNRERHPVRDPQLRRLPRRLPRHAPAAAPAALESGGPRPGG
jgi:uncharacterized membrane protein YbhN (UPF0104 family)